MSDALAIALGTAGALVLAWLGTETHAYRIARRSHGPGAPGRGRLRAAVYAGAVVAGGVLGLALGAALRN
jgi:hypothetical protein